MRILFICGSLEPGKDGVGDYTRRLAGEIQANGIETCLVAINDKHLKDTFVQEKEAVSAANIFRISAHMSDQSRYQKLSGLCREIQPHVISLQYVPYSFSDKGAPLTLAKHLKQVYKEAVWHVMVHEPFLDNVNLSIKNRIVRQLQIISLRRIEKYLHPVWHTSIRQYQQRIEKELSVPVSILGLFGNINLVGGNESEVKRGASTKEIEVRGVYFGTVPPPRHQQIFIQKFYEQFQLLPCKVKLVFCGKGGTDERLFIEALQGAVLTLGESKISIMVLGVLSVTELSHLFSSADFGIARVPPRFIGKSGSAIGMLEHGLPLWIPMGNCAAEIKEEVDFRPDLCFTDLRDFDIQSGRKTAINRLPVIASQFIGDVQAKQNNV